MRENNVVPGGIDPGGQAPVNPDEPAEVPPSLELIQTPKWTAKRPGWPEGVFLVDVNNSAHVTEGVIGCGKRVGVNMVVTRQPSRPFI